MKSIKGHLFMHWDSRGGSIFVAEEDKDKAIAKYNEKTLGGEWSVEDILWEDYTGAAELFYPDDVRIEDLDGTDLEKHGYVVVDINQWSLEDCEDPTMEWPPTYIPNENILNSKTNEEYLEEGGVVEMEFVPNGKEPDKFKNTDEGQTVTGWWWPRWDDDAFGMWLVI